MDLAIRFGRANELEICVPMACDSFAYTPAEQRETAVFWHELLETGVARFEIMEDRDAPPDQQVVFFGLVVFLQDEFWRECLSDPAPFLTRRMLAWRKSGRSPCLSAQEVRTRNSPGGAGLIQLLLSGGPDWALNPDLNMPVVVKFPEWYYGISTGFRLNETVFEAIGPSSAWASHVGYTMRSAYDSYYAAHPEPLPFRRAALYGATRSEMPDSYGAILSPLFAYSPPRIFFSGLEQIMLRRAIYGEDDHQIAGELFVSLATVHKRWRAIYNRIDLRYPELLAVPSDPSNAGRGGEKRTRLLQYLRRHPEELSPVLQPDER